MTGRLQRVLAVLALALGSCRGASAPGGTSPAADRPLRVAAAADLGTTMTELVVPYRHRTGREVVFTYGSSGLLAQQIAQGAPFDVFCSASSDHVDDLVKKGRIVPGSRVSYARGQLCLYARPGGPRVTGVADLGRRDLGRISLANPEHAPYGKAAEESLRRAGVYEQVKDRLVFGENVMQAVQYAESGNVDVAFVACSLVTGPRGSAERTTVVPADQHQPIDQALGIIKGGDEDGARRFVALLRSPEGQDVLRRHGFSPPPATPAR
jgi:molybdate transport system substrate-binding protein